MLVETNESTEEQIHEEDIASGDPAQPVEAVEEIPSGESTERDIKADCDNESEPADATVAGKRRVWWKRVFAFGALPALVLLIAMAAAFLKWQDASTQAADAARLESLQAAKDGTIKLLSYRPETVDKDLGAARHLLTGTFRDSYTELTRTVVIPGAKERKISATVDVPAVASISASAEHAVVLVFVNQTVVIGNDAPTATASTVKVTLEKIDGRWLIADFTPV